MSAREATKAAGGEKQRERADPCTMVILGAAGDLSRRKLLPAIYNLAARKLLHDDFRILGISRQEQPDDAYRTAMRDAVQGSDEIAAFDPTAWEWLAQRMTHVAGDITAEASYAAISARLSDVEARSSQRNRLIYLAIPPSVFVPSVTNLASSGVGRRTPSDTERPWVRLVVEKPFGRDFRSAEELNRALLDRFGEHQVYRIDHYLGKETVQNLLVFRFANALFEPVWNRNFISGVTISATETDGVAGRGKYYEESGVLRDMFQNHLLQMLTLAAMEPPTSFNADAVRDEKVKVLRSIRPVVRDGEADAVRAQYGAGEVAGEKVKGYREEPDVARASRTPTFTSLRLAVDNWRWQGVPFVLTSGKRLKRRVSEIVVQFRRPPSHIFGPRSTRRLPPNLLVIRVQPDEGISLGVRVKRPGVPYELTPDLELTTVEMDFAYHQTFGATPSPAYETLLLDTMIGDATLFARSDEVVMAWHVIDPLIQLWERDDGFEMPSYPAGSEGPAGAAQVTG